MAAPDQLPLATLEVTLWFLAHLSANFETRYLSPDSEEPLITGLLKCLHFSTDQQNTNEASEIVKNALVVLVDLTKCERWVFGRVDVRSDFAAAQIVKHERSCSY